MTQGGEEDKHDAPHPLLAFEMLKDSVGNADYHKEVVFRRVSITGCIRLNHAQNLSPKTSGNDTVVLLHGLFATKRSMQKAMSCLQDRFLVINWGYPTLRRTVQHLGNDLLPLLQRLSNDEGVRSINFLTHSFGAIILRYALQLDRIGKLGRAVMMAPPNAGSALAKYSFGAFDFAFPAIGQITEAADSLPNNLKPVKDIDVGIIAAETDFIVSVTNTRLENQSDHCVLSTSHFQLPKHDEALDKSKSFLLTGQF